MKYTLVTHLLGLAAAVLLLGGCGGTKGPQTAGILLEVQFADKMWEVGGASRDGTCVTCGGEGMSPELIVRGIPEKAKAVVVEFFNVTMEDPAAVADCGAFRVLTKGQTELVIPSVPEQSMSLPEDVLVERVHGSATARPGAYLAPCTCEVMDRYEIQVTADKHEKWREEGYEVLGQRRISMGYCCGK
jgi:hypothetical protein